MKTLVYDIETAPLLAFAWQAKTEFIPATMFIHDSFMLSWAGKWFDGKQVFGRVLTPAEARAQDDARIVQDLADTLRASDLAIAHNIDRFDIPMLNNRLLILEKQPLGNVKTLDTLTLARRSFRLASNKLDYLAKVLGLEPKIETDFDLWVRAYHGQVTALKYMYRYNRHDVVLLQQVYERLAPYVKGLPRLIDGNGDPEACPACGAKMHRDGSYRTNASTFQKWRCSKCGRTARGRKADASKRVDLVPLP